jgi:tRNA(Ile)-lysidine synthase
VRGSPCFPKPGLGRDVSELREHVELSIRERSLFHPEQPILVAVSGGVDSMVLLQLLKELAPKYGWRLTVAHLNHQLRGRSSDADERLVSQTSARLRLPCVVERADVRGFARRHRLSTEMAARKLRHDFLARMAGELKCSTIALAHHADDQLELFFLRLLRGAGSEGVAGMKWSNPSPSHSKIQLVRPLLDQPKRALCDYAREHKLRFREDATNASVDIQRNRIRHELLPLLRKHYQPALDRTVLRVMEILAAESDFVREAAATWLAGKRARPRPGAFQALPAAVQRRCLHLQLVRLGVTPEFELIERLRGKAGQRVCVSAGWVVRDPKGLVHLQSASPVKQRPEDLLLKLTGRAGEVQFSGASIGWQIVHNGSPAHGKKRVVGQELFDADRVGKGVRLRHWRPGDRFQPIGMSTAVKLQDLFTNQKVPRDRRHELILAESPQTGIFWVEGLRIGERFKLTKQTIRRLQWRWQRL